MVVEPAQLGVMFVGSDYYRTVLKVYIFHTDDPGKRADHRFGQA